MDAQNIDKSVLKSIIREIIKEDISLFKDTIKEILLENQIIVSNEQKERRERLEKLINDDFKKYDDVFKALA